MKATAQVAALLSAANEYHAARDAYHAAFSAWCDRYPEDFASTAHWNAPSFKEICGAPLERLQVAEKQLQATAVAASSDTP
jgi:hypothetical protein